MIQYTSINDAWGNNTEKEIFKNLNNKNIVKGSENCGKPHLCEMFNQNFIKDIKNLINSLNDIKEHLIIDNKKEPKVVENIGNSFTDVIQIFKSIDKSLIILILVVLIVIILILLVTSFKKSFDLNTSQKGFYFSRDELEKFKILLELKN